MKTILILALSVMIAACGCPQKNTVNTINNTANTIKEPVVNVLTIVDDQAEFLTGYMKVKVKDISALAATPIKAVQIPLLGGAQFIFGLANGVNEKIVKKIIPSGLPFGNLSVYEIDNEATPVETPLQSVIATADTLGALDLMSQAAEPLKAFYDAVPGNLKSITYKVIKTSGAISVLEIAGTVIVEGDIALGNAVFTITKTGEKVATNVVMPFKK